MSDKIYIVCGMMGEYDTRANGLCGAFLAASEAQEYASDLKRRSDAYRTWYDSLCDEINKRRPPFAVPFDPVAHDKIVAEARRQLPPEPGYVAGDEFEVIEATIGERLGWVNLT